MKYFVEITCKDCKLPKPVTEFTVSSTKNGRTFYIAYCKACEEKRKNATSKICKDCGEEKELKDFPLSCSRGKTGHRTRCKECYCPLKSEENKRLRPTRVKYFGDYKKKAKENITPPWAKACLRKNGILAEEINFMPHIVELKRNLLILKREIKKQSNGHNI